MASGFLVIISAPSGTGKSTVCRKLIARDKTLKYSVSYTTRSPRSGELHGRHYYFVSPDEFRSRIRGREFLEWAKVHGNYYGTPRRYAEEQVASGHVVLLDIDVQGAAAIRQKRSDTITIFLLPPSWSSLKRRLQLRRDSRASIEERLGNARKELRYAQSYDYWVVNDALAMAVKQVEAIILAEELRAGRHKLSEVGLESVLY